MISSSCSNCITCGCTIVRVRHRADQSSTFPNSGGAFKVQVYSPYIFMNKTGLPFDLAAKTGLVVSGRSLAKTCSGVSVVPIGRDADD